MLRTPNVLLFSNSHSQAYLGSTPPNLAGRSLAWPAPHELRREPTVESANMKIFGFVFICLFSPSFSPLLILYHYLTAPKPLSTPAFLHSVILAALAPAFVINFCFFSCHAVMLVKISFVHIIEYRK